MFHGKNASGKHQGGGSGNHIRSLSDKSNNFVQLNSKAGIKVQDKGGNFAHWDGAGNIFIESGETLSIKIAKTQSMVTMDKEGNIAITGTQNISLAVGGSLIEMTEKEISISGENIKIYGSKNHIKGNSTINGGKVIIN
jgi:hypothetical protein